MGIKILVIDDSKFHRDAMAQLLEDENIEVFYAENGFEGIQKMREIDSLDMVITDLEMPKMNGLEMMEAICQDEKIKNIPIAFCTRQFSLDHHSKAKKMGAKMFLPKPIKDKEQLFTAIEKVSRKKVI